MRFSPYGHVITILEWLGVINVEISKNAKTVKNGVDHF